MKNRYSQRHYKDVAAILRIARRHALAGPSHPWAVRTVDFAIKDFADLFKRDNLRFDRARFLKACQP